MKKFLVLYMAKPAAFKKMMTKSTPEDQKKGMDAWMKWMERSSGVPRGRWSAFRQNQEGRRQRNLGYEERGRRLFDRASQHGRCRSQAFRQEAPAFQMSGGWIEIVEILPVPGM